MTALDLIKWPGAPISELPSKISTMAPATNSLLQAELLRIRESEIEARLDSLRSQAAKHTDLARWDNTSTGSPAY